ncbi:MAG: hypothetical protein Q7J78_06365, partial [Clostridiales bacterium]|nr:hypothetical protein [Clostridiales bacterium]
MSKRVEFINYVKKGGKCICSPQIGAGAGFDTKLAGKAWISETTLDDTIDTVQRFDMVPLLNTGLCDLGECNPKIAWESGLVEKNEGKIKTEAVLKTPVGMLCRYTMEEQFKGSFN